MRLRSIEAVRYGRLRDQSLGDLGDGLTVVAGPNEAGKSTFTALVRHALYGFPTQREREPGYFVPGDGRLVRLVFDEDGGRWIVERSEATHGGDVHVRAVSGPERPALLADVARGVSPLAYRVVFGFGLEDMARIEELRGSEDDIIARLYAASAGLRVSPHEVRAAVDREAAELFTPRGRKPSVNALVSALRAVRSQIREMRQHAEAFQAEQQRLRDLEHRLAEAREVRDAARDRATELVVAVERADERLALVTTQEGVLLDLRRQRKQLSAEAEAIVVDDALVESGPELEALIGEASAFGHALEGLRDAEERRATATIRAEDATARTGLTAEAVAALKPTVERGFAVDEAREDTQRLQLACEGREAELQRAAASLSQAREAATAALASIALPQEGAEDAIAERLAALDAIEALRGGSALASRAGVDVPAVIMLISGIAAIGTGVFFRQWATVVIGGVLAAAAVFFLARATRGVPALPVTDERPYLTLLGLDQDAGTLELSRMRRALEGARALVTAQREAETRAADAERDVALARDALAARRSLWAAWLVEQGLPGDLTPAAAAQLLMLVRDALTAQAVAHDARRDAERIAARLDEFALRLGEAARPFVQVADPMSRDDVPVVANRVGERMVAARAAVARRAEVTRDLGAIDVRIQAEQERASAALGDLREILERFGLTDGGTHDDLRVLALRAGATAQEADRAFDDLGEAKNQLEGRLESEAHERRGGELQLEEAGLAERLAEAVDGYLVLAVAARLLGNTQERYERERQPEVVKHAEDVFRRITHDAYVGLSVPIGGGRIEVFDRSAEAKASDVLSRGTAEQLYLALRLGLIAQLSEVGCGLPVLMDDVFVNFDPDRKRGAAEAVAELATSRQVVFFTCHPETMALFEAVAPDHVRLDLGRCPA